MNNETRIAFLERQMERMAREKAEALAALDRAAMLGRLETAYAKLDTPQPIYTETVLRVREMIALREASIYAVDERTDDFTLVLADPPEARKHLDHEVNALIADQSFALALSSPAPTFFVASDRVTHLLLHPLSTPSRTRGMFVARLAQDKATISDITLALLSLVMNACAMALESYELYRFFSESNKRLEATVAKRTRDIREAGEQMQAMLKSSHDAMIMIDQDDRVRFWNTKAEEMFGYTEAEVLDHRMHELIVARDEDLLAARKAMEEFAFTGTGPVMGTVMEFTARRKDGSYFPVERSVAALQINGKWHAVGSLRDITVRKQAEAEMIRLNTELNEQKNALEEDLRLAAEVQMRLLPDKLIRFAGLEVDWRFEPSATIGGDIFNLVQLPGGKIAAYVLDVSGHGAPAALVTASVDQVLDAQCGMLADNGVAVSPDEVIRRLEDAYPLERFDKFFSFLYVIYDFSNSRLEYANAGHPPPLLCRPGATVNVLESGGTIIGMGSLHSAKTDYVDLHPDDVLLLYTDACLEHENDAGEQFGLERLCASLAAHCSAPVDAILDAVYAEIRSFAPGKELEDDITLLCIKYIGL